MCVCVRGCVGCAYSPLTNYCQIAVCSSLPNWESHCTSVEETGYSSIAARGSVPPPVHLFLSSLEERKVCKTREMGALSPVSKTLFFVSA